jgi:plasmid rolling circle replication initiator protein Rep
MMQSKKQDARSQEVEPKFITRMMAYREPCDRLSDSFKRLGKEGKASRVRECATQLQVAYIMAEERWQLFHANFCRERLCPMCAWHRSRQIFREVSRVMDGVQNERPDLQPIFLTLTMRNCSAAEMNETLDAIFKGWHNMVSGTSKVKRLTAGWFRALEITYNEQDDTYHPHIHAILLMPPSYFTSPKDYMSIMDWVKVWRKAAKLDYDPSCDIRAIGAGSDKSGAVAEVAKYTLKSTDYLKDDEKMTDKLVSEFGKAIKGRRLYAYGGIMKVIAKQLNLDAKANFTPGEIRDKAGNILRKDIDYILSNYRWNVGLTRYNYEGKV